MSKFKFVRGRKTKNDVIMLYNNLPVEMKDVAKMILFFICNEDTLYPPSKGFKGGQMFVDYITETLRTRELPKQEKYKIKKNKRTKINEQGEISCLKMQ